MIFENGFRNQKVNKTDKTKFTMKLALFDYFNAF